MGLDRLAPHWRPLLFWLSTFAVLHVGRRVCLVAQRSPLLCGFVRGIESLVGLRHERKVAPAPGGLAPESGEGCAVGRP